MRFYQMDADLLAKEFNSDLKNGLTVFDEMNQKGGIRSFLARLTQLEWIARSKFDYAGIVALICYGITAIFALLNYTMSTLWLTLVALFLTAILYFTKNILLSVCKKEFLRRICLEKQTVTAIRNGAEQQLFVNDIKVGDILCLKQGDILPADVRVVFCENLYADESVVFDRKIPAFKHSNPIAQENLPAERIDNMLWKGSSLHSGACTGIVVAINEDCYIQKTGGRKNKRQHSSFLSRQNSAGTLISYLFLAVACVLFVISAFITGQFVESVLLIGAVATYVFVNPLSFFNDWTYYHTAKKLYQEGTVIRNLDAFDGMDQEKDLYFDAHKLVEKCLDFSHLVPIGGNEKNSLSYFALGVNNPVYLKAIQKNLKQNGLSIDELEQLAPGIQRKRDGDGNYCCSFVKGDGVILTASGYWKNLLPVVGRLDDQLLKHIDELEHQGKLIWLIAAKNSSYMPGNLDFIKNRVELEALSLLVFNVKIDPTESLMIHELQKAKMRVHLYCDFSATFGQSMMRLYDLNDVVSSLPQKPNYTMPKIKNQALVANDQSLPVEKERATLVLSKDCSAHRVIFMVKCMLCGLKRAMNFALIASFLSLIISFVLLLQKATIVYVVGPLLLLSPILAFGGHYLVESTKNCTRHFRSLLLGVVCGLVGLGGVIFQSDCSLVALLLSVVLLSMYLLIRCSRSKKYGLDWVILAVFGLVLIFTGVFGVNDGAAAMLFAVFAPLATFVLDLFY